MDVRWRGRAVAAGAALTCLLASLSPWAARDAGQARVSLGHARASLPAATPVPSALPAATPVPSVAPAATPSSSGTASASLLPTQAASATSPPTGTATATSTATILATATAAPCPSATVMPTPSPGGAAVASPIPSGAGHGLLARTIPLPCMATPVVVVVARRTGRALVLADGATRVLDARTGMPLSGRPVALPLAPCVAAVDERRGWVVVAGSLLTGTLTTGGVTLPDLRHGVVAVLDARDGAVLRRVPVGGLPCALALDAPAGRVLVREDAPDPEHQRVVVLDEASGRVVRAVALQGRARDLAVDAATHRAFVLSDDQPVYTNASSVVVLDTRGGAVLRTVTVQGQPLQSVAVDARTGRAFVSSRGTLTVLDAATGRVLRALPAPDPLRGQATGGAYLRLVADEPAGRILGLLENRLAVLDARTGALLSNHTSLGPDPIAAGPLIDPRAGRAFVLSLNLRVGMHGLLISGPGYVGVFDAATGRRLRTVTVGAVGNPHAQSMAVDPDSGLVFSLNDSDNSVSVIDGRHP